MRRRILNYGGSAFVHEISLLTADNDVDVYFLRKPVLSHAPNKASYRNRESLFGSGRVCQLSALAKQRQ